MNLFEQIWVRKGQYPGISMGAVIGSDGAGEGLQSLPRIY